MPWQDPMAQPGNYFLKSILPIKTFLKKWLSSRRRTCPPHIHTRCQVSLVLVFIALCIFLWKQLHKTLSHCVFPFCSIWSSPRLISTISCTPWVPGIWMNEWMNEHSRCAFHSLILTGQCVSQPLGATHVSSISPLISKAATDARPA